LEAFAQNPHGFVSAVKSLAGIGIGVDGGNSKIDLARAWLRAGAPRKIREEIVEGGEACLYQRTLQGF